MVVIGCHVASRIEALLRRPTGLVGHEVAGIVLGQIYRTEPWHFELRIGAVDVGCPRMDADPTHDPRMQP